MNQKRVPQCPRHGDMEYGYPLDSMGILLCWKCPKCERNRQLRFSVCLGAIVIGLSLAIGYLVAAS